MITRAHGNLENLHNALSSRGIVGDHESELALSFLIKAGMSGTRANGIGRTPVDLTFRPRPVPFPLPLANRPRCIAVVTARGINRERRLLRHPSGIRCNGYGGEVGHASTQDRQGEGSGKVGRAITLPMPVGILPKALGELPSGRIHCRIEVCVNAEEPACHVGVPVAFSLGGLDLLQTSCIETLLDRVGGIESSRPSVCRDPPVGDKGNGLV